MSFETELIDLTRKYSASDLTLGDVFMWVQDRQEALTELPDDSLTNQLADTIMLAEVEQFSNGADANEVRRWVAEEHPLLFRAMSRP